MISDVSASHMISTELGWTCVGQDSFLIKQTTYLDCNGSSFSPGIIEFLCATSGVSITKIILNASFTFYTSLKLFFSLRYTINS